MPFSFPRTLAFAGLLIVLAAVVGCSADKAAMPEPPPPRVTVAHPVAYPVQTYKEYNGNLEAVETNKIEARVKGFLNAIEFTEGKEVKAGDPLYQIDPREYQAAVAKSNADIAKAQADVANAKAQIKLAETELTRVNESFSRGVGSKADVDKAVAQVAANQAQFDSAQANVAAGKAALDTANINLGYTTIKAPIDGRISRTLITKGNLVGQNESTLLTTIVRMDPIYVYFDVPERDLVEYQRSLKGQSQTLSSDPPRVEVGVATEEGHPHIGKLDFRENRVEPGTGTIKLRGILPNPQVSDRERLLYPGLYARVRIPTGKPDSRLAIPEEALMTGQEGRFVYVVNESNVVEKRTVTVGPQIWAPPPPGSPPQPGWSLVGPKSTTPLQSVVAIMNGLNAGDRVIVNGLQKTRPGGKVDPEPWELHDVPPPKPPEKK